MNKLKKITWRERRAACKKELAQALASGESLHAVLGRYPDRARDPARRVAAFAHTRRGFALWEKVNLLWGITPQVRVAYEQQWEARKAAPAPAAAPEPGGTTKK